MKVSAWEDEIFTYTGLTELVYCIYDENNNLIYTGRAYAKPNKAQIDINVSQIARNYLGSELPDSAFDGVEFRTGNSVLPNATHTFTLADSKGNVLDTYKYLNCWDYHTMYALIDNSTMHFSINRPINNHKAIGQYTFSSTLLKSDKVRVAISQTASGATACGYGALYYASAIGSWESFLIEGNMKKKNTYEKYNIDSYALSNTLQYGHRTLNNTISESWELQTHYMTDEESRNICENLFSSNNVYFHDFVENRIYPVTITDTSVEVKNWKNQGRKHFIYKINIKNSQDKQRI